MKKQRVYILALCCLLICSVTACGRDKNGNNNNSVTGGTTVTPVLPTKAPTVTPTVTPDHTNGGILDGVEDVGDGIINGTEDVIDGVGNAVDDIGNDLTGNDTNRNAQ